MCLTLWSQKLRNDTWIHCGSFPLLLTLLFPCSSNSIGESLSQPFQKDLEQLYKCKLFLINYIYRYAQYGLLCAQRAEHIYAIKVPQTQKQHLFLISLDESDFQSYGVSFENLDSSGS